MGEPQFMQKHLRPLSELNFLTLLADESTESLELATIAHVAGEVPANFVQLAQQQYRAECNSPFMVN
jgi:hypothetical protein